jgi:uncharacterized delta-60 repeat protein
MKTKNSSSFVPALREHSCCTAVGAALIAFMLFGSALAPDARAQYPTADDFNPGADTYVLSLAVQADGKILVGGYFTTVGGQPRERIARLHADGTLDVGFNPGASSDVYCLAVQADGKILVGGWFTNLCGQPRSGIGRLNGDGTLDTGFNPGEAPSDVRALLVQADGKILVGGWFTNLCGQPRSNIGRLHADGTLDAAFDPGSNIMDVNSLAVQADGKILVGGYFWTPGGPQRIGIGRLNADGTLDAAFNPGVDGEGEVMSLAVQADGKILLGGGFSTLGSQSRTNLGRLNADGSLDAAFDPGADGYVSSLAVQADGKILVGGDFWTLGGQPRIGIGRLSADGSLDAGFDPRADGEVAGLALQPDGKILAGGVFNTLGGKPRICIGRLNATGPVTQSLTRDNSTITWRRGGTSPEVWRTTFEHSPDGVSWTFLGAGTRIPGGWQLTSVSLPPGGTIRARGHVTGGVFNASSWFVETLSTARLGNCGVSTNGFGFDINWAPGMDFVVEACTNFDQFIWHPVQTNTMTADRIQFSDPGWKDRRRGLYRVRAR